jgi:hypothetical protein
MSERVDLVKQIKGINTYSKVIDSQFTELISVEPTTAETIPTVDEFFNLYDQLFLNIPISGEINSHEYLVARSTEYIGGSFIDPEKAALIEEINSLRQQLLEIGETFLTTDKLIR